MRGNTEITNIRVWLEGAGNIIGAASWYMNITDAWTFGKTPVQVKTSSPGPAPVSEPVPNLTRNGGGSITGTGDSEASQYIYITGNIGVDVPTGERPEIKLKVKFDYH